MKLLRRVAALVACLASAPAFAACQFGRVAEFPVTMEGLRPEIDVKINGQPARLLVDTGAFFSSMTPASARRVGLGHASLPEGFTLSGVNGVVDATAGVAKTLTLAGVDLPNHEFIVAGGDIGGGADGLFGQEFLHAFDIEIDLAAGVMRFWRPRGCGASRSLAYWATDVVYSQIPMESVAGNGFHAVGNVKVNGHTLRATFDTGAATSALTLAGARRAGIDLKGVGVERSGVTSGLGRRLIRTWAAPVDSFEIGGIKVLRTKLEVAAMDINTDMLIGDDFFLSTRVLISNSQNRIYFTYNGGRMFNMDAAREASARKIVAGTVSETAMPTDSAGFDRRGNGLLARGDVDHALADYDKAVALDPKNARALLDRARARQEKKQPFLAMADLDAALKLTPNDPAILARRAAYRLQGHDEAGAKADIDLASKTAAPQDPIRRGLAGLYLEAREYHAAVAELNQWVPLNQGDAYRFAALNERCWARALGNFELDQALVDCTQAVRQSKGDAAILDSRGLVRLRLGQYEAAIADYDAALAKRADIAWSTYCRGLARLKLGRKGEGQADLDAASKIEPGIADRAAKVGLAP